MSNLHADLRNRLYAGDFDWNGRRYDGRPQPLVSRELWERVQRGLDGRRASGSGHRTKRDFAFSGLIKCGHCGSALVGELKKKWYVYLPFLGGLRLATRSSLGPRISTKGIGEGMPLRLGTPASVMEYLSPLSGLDPETVLTPGYSSMNRSLRPDDVVLIESNWTSVAGACSNLPMMDWTGPTLANLGCCWMEMTGRPAASARTGLFARIPRQLPKAQS
jgi:Recombinase zinc beta ribbon domain/Recombinase